MREIKFRAWDIYNKEMVYSETPPSFSFWKWFAYDSRTPLMEYTGLKDKNGKEIYEGDIVKSEYRDNLIIIIIKWREKKAQWSIEDFGIVEVIGNIYENPELLDKEEVM